MTVHNGVHHDPDKLKQLEVERLELGLYHFLQEITLNSLFLAISLRLLSIKYSLLQFIFITDLPTQGSFVDS